MIDLIQTLCELPLVAGIEPNEPIRSIVQRLEKPLRYLCLESGVPELYESYQTRIRNRLLAESDIKEGKIEPGAAGNGQIASTERKRSL